MFSRPDPSPDQVTRSFSVENISAELREALTILESEGCSVNIEDDSVSAFDHLRLSDRIVVIGPMNIVKGVLGRVGLTITESEPQKQPESHAGTDDDRLLISL